MLQITTIDIVIFIIYLIAVMVVGFIVGRKEHTQAIGYFLAGRTIPWYAVGLSMVATCISTEQFVGAGAKAYDVGMAVLNWEWAVIPSFTLLIYVFMPIYFRRKIYTIPEYLERRFSSHARTIFSGITLVSYIFINLAGVLFSGAYTFHVIFGLPLVASIWILSVVTGVYTIYGGLASVVWTDTLQGILLIGGGALVVGAGLLKIPGGLAGAIGTDSHSHLILPLDHPELPWTAIVVLALSTNTWYSCTNQFYIQRCLGAKNEWHARMGVVFAMFLAIILGFTVEFSGLVGYRLVNLGVLPAPDESNSIYPLMIRYLVPKGLTGIVFAGLVAAIMSTVSSLINSIATLFSMDIYHKLIRPSSSEKHLIVIGQSTGTLFLIFGALCAPIVGTFPTIFDYFQQCWAILAAPITVIFMAGVLWKRANNIGAISTMVLGVIAIPLTFWLQRSVLPKGFNFYNLVGIMCLIFLGWMVVVSLLTKPQPKETIASALWTPDLAVLPPEEAPKPYPWYKSVLLWWIICAVITGYLYIRYW